MHIFSRSGILARYTPQANSIYPKEFKEEGVWTTVYYNAYVTGYNTRLVTARALPKSYDDLLDPKWKGGLMMEGTKADWFAGMPPIMVGIGLSAQAPHANAAKVFLDFVLSREGQKLMQTPGRLIARGDLANEQAAMLKGLKIIPVDPALAEKLD